MCEVTLTSLYIYYVKYTIHLFPLCRI